MGSRRTERLNEQLKREIARLAHREVRDPRVESPTITDVEVTPDLWVARVYVRAGPDGEDTDGAVEGLRNAAPFIRHRLGEELHLRRIPELRFEPDRTLERALRIEKILREVLPEEEGKGDSARAASTEDPGDAGAREPDEHPVPDEEGDDQQARGEDREPGAQDR